MARASYTVYTDGSCRQMKYGAYAGIILHSDNSKEIVSGEIYNATSSRAELLAAVKTLQAIHKPAIVTLYSDSKYTVDTINKWLKVWYKNNYKGYNNQQLANVDILEQLRVQIKKHKVKAIWIKGHSGNVYNEECDKIAQSISKAMLLKIQTS